MRYCPIIISCKNLKVKPDLYAGFRSIEYYTNEFKEYVDQIFIATEDGSVSYKGYALDLLDANKCIRKYMYAVLCR